ncbi:XylR N-terminal domain-containing protein [Nannocystaceae bacterium ST9]
MKVTDIDLGTMLKFSPDTGRLLLGTDRMLLFRQEAFSTLRKLMIEQLGEKLARGILSQFGFRCGMGDHKALVEQYAWDSELDEMSAGPVMHMWEGIVHVQPKKLEFDRKTGAFHMIGEWRNSYEAEIHLAEYGKSDTPICHTLTGYASGWCSAFLGAPLVAVETQCVGKGDAFCAFEIRRDVDWGPEADRWKRSLEVNTTSLSSELEHKLREVEQYRATMATLGIPIIQVWKDVVVLPIIGAIDSQRSEQITATLVARVARDGIRCVLVDLTGVESVDTHTAEHFVRMGRALQLLGARCTITGIRAEVAQTLTLMGVEFDGLPTLRSLEQGLEDSLRGLGYAVTRT